MEFHVAANGSDTNPGTAAKPFATLARARDAVRELDRSKLPLGPILVKLAAGTYPLAEPLELTAEDSGSVRNPIVYYAAKGDEVRITGAKAVSGWQPVTDPAILQRLPEVAHAQVRQADLKALGITDFQGINNPHTYGSDPGLEVFYQDRAMTLARYPNDGWIRLKEVLDNGQVVKSGDARTPDGKFVYDDPGPARWVGEEGVWLHGFWYRDWADVRIPLGEVDPAADTICFPPLTQGTYGVRRNQWFYAENVLPELDSPGEWYLDREAGILYFWPPDELTDRSVVVSVTRDLFQLTDVAHVTLRGLLLEAARGTAVVINGGTADQVVACTIRNLGNWAVRVTEGTKHGVVGCDIYQTGQGGVHLEGGDRQTLTPAGLYADNNHIHHTARWDPVYQQGIALFGVGNSATHNLLDNLPHICIGFSHNDMTIEYNEIHSSVFQSNDAGAIYTSPPNETWSMRGHKIRYNYLHNIHGFESRGCNGVYLDDCFSSADISFNIFYDVFRPILIGGGRDNPMTNNLFVNCNRAFSIDARGLGWAKGVGTFATKELHDLNYQQPPWSTKYPELVGILEDEPLAPKGNSMIRNVCWGGAWGQTQPQALKLTTFEDNLIDVDPQFVGTPPASFKLAPDSPALKLGFEQIPFAKIGVYESPDRASWPVTSTLRQDAPTPPPPPARQRTDAPKPTFDIPRRTAAVTIDGKLNADEWLGLDASRGVPVQEDVWGDKVEFASRAWMSWDDDALYVAFDNAVDPEQDMNLSDAWGSNDAVEVSLCPVAGKDEPILVLRGFACGTFQSSDESGVKLSLAQQAAQGVEYQASVLSKSRWTAEFRFPLKSLGLTPRAGQKYALNLAVRKQGADSWVLWRGTGNTTWYLPEAGLVTFGK